MQWIRYELKTTTDASSRIGELLTEFGVNGYELQDNVPLSAEEERKMYTDIPAELPPDNGEAVLVFYSDVIDGDFKAVILKDNAFHGKDTSVFVYVQ